jgi:hypothetical protein
MLPKEQLPTGVTPRANPKARFWTSENEVLVGSGVGQKARCAP